jgi:hypothetical protein
MSMIDIVNVVNISVITPPAGLAAYSINNLVCFTKDTPAVALTGTFAAYASASEVATAWGSASQVYEAAVAVFSQSPNILTGGGLFIVIPMLTDEVLEQAIVRASGLIYFGGCSATYALGTAGPTGYTGATGVNLEALRGAATAESEGKILFLADSAIDSLSAGGLAYEAEDRSLKHTRVLHHTVADELDKFKWAYASRGMSTNFSAINTTSTLHLKSLAGVASDTGMTQTILNSAKTVGADVYVNIAGQACVMSHGANEFFDDVYNLDWFVGALEVAGFNYLRQTGTKIPQTEQGMDGLKAAYRRVCSQAVSSRFVAPGSWTGSDTFGDPEDFKRNITDFGFYIYSQPVALQAVADRAAREAPVVQIAIKYAGAIHSTDVIVNINK